MPIEQLADRPLTEPDPSRLPLDAPDRKVILEIHARAMRDDEPGYIDPVSGLFVLTASYLRDRGFCCERGCRHCPYAA